MKQFIPSALTIAGTDPTGGAGIQADLKTFQEREVYGMSVVTSAIAQNTLGVQRIEHLPVSFIEEQMKSVLSDIVPDVIKTGMVAVPEMMEVIAQSIGAHKIPYVIDPVMIAKSGDHLMNTVSKQVLRDRLIPLATVVTPNIPETDDLLVTSIKSTTDAEIAAKRMVNELGAKAAVIKGGHFTGDAIDILYDGSSIHHFPSTRFDTKHTHGTGCTYSAVIAAELAKGKSIYEAVATAKAFITDAIRYSLELGKGNGPTNHWGYRLQAVPKVKEEAF